MFPGGFFLAKKRDTAEYNIGKSTLLCFDSKIEKLLIFKQLLVYYESQKFQRGFPRYQRHDTFEGYFFLVCGLYIDHGDLGYSKFRKQFQHEHQF